MRTAAAARSATAATSARRAARVVRAGRAGRARRGDRGRRWRSSSPSRRPTWSSTRGGGELLLRGAAGAAGARGRWRSTRAPGMASVERGPARRLLDRGQPGHRPRRDARLSHRLRRLLDAGRAAPRSSPTSWRRGAGPGRPGLGRRRGQRAQARRGGLRRRLGGGGRRRTAIACWSPTGSATGSARPTPPRGRRAVLRADPTCGPAALLGGASTRRCAARAAPPSRSREIDRRARRGALRRRRQHRRRRSSRRRGSRQLVSHNGTVGHDAAQGQEFTYPWPPAPLLVMHSDGLVHPLAISTATRASCAAPDAHRRRALSATSPAAATTRRSCVAARTGRMSVAALCRRPSATSRTSCWRASARARSRRCSASTRRTRRGSPPRSRRSRATPSRTRGGGDGRVPRRGPARAAAPGDPRDRRGPGHRRPRRGPRGPVPLADRHGARHRGRAPPDGPLRDRRRSPGEGTTVTLGKLLPRRAPGSTPAGARARSRDALARQRAAESASRRSSSRTRSCCARSTSCAQRQDELSRAQPRARGHQPRRGRALRRARREGRPPAPRRRAEVALPLQHEPRVPHAAELDPGALAPAARATRRRARPPSRSARSGFIRKAAEDLSELVNDLLDLAKVEAGKIVDPARRVRRRRPVRRAARHAAAAARQRVGRPSSSRSPRACRRCTPTRARSRRSCATSSPTRSSSPSAARSASARAVWRPTAASVAFSVADTGIGIAPEDQERIFEEFTQIDNPVQQRVQGTGLGLPLCASSRAARRPRVGRERARRRLDLHRHDSAHLRGAEARAAAPTSAGPRTAARRRRLRDQAGAPRVLVIDDDEIARYLVRNHLAGAPFVVTETADPVQGLREARADRPASSCSTW